MVNTIITADIIGIIAGLIILYGVCFEIRHQNNKTRYFALLICVNVVSCLADAVSWIFDGQMDHYILLMVSTTITYSIMYLEGYAYLKFAEAYISGKIMNETEIVFPFHRTFKWFCGIMGLIITVLCFAGKLFSIEDAAYSDTQSTSLYLVTAMLMFAYMIAMVYRYRVALGAHDCTAMMVYLLIPIACVIVNLMIPNASLTYAAIALSIILQYVMLQYDNENHYIIRDQFLSSVSRHDELTGLLNRRAFTAVFENINPDEKVGIVFFDVNGLKRTNDTFGHEAGDELLIKFSTLLLNYFRKDEIFRVSGDEFVIIMPNVPESIFNMRIKRISSALQEGESRIAAMGHAYGSGAVISELSKTAENRMYDDKARFYKKHPEFMRV